MIVEDLDIYLEDHGLPCTCKAINFLGIKDSGDDNIASSGINAQVNMVSLLVKTSDVIKAGIKHGVVILVDGVAYSARNPARLDDGAFSSIPITLVPI
ncbi:hypothetical protein ACO0LG_22640 [Undibacterium sp. Ji42W]|uniref:hypothetical protein n=1 Tax=Undibacterium sp. Ji42W TaxID=3413039 RepID=UPI003BF1C4B2